MRREGCGPHDPIRGCLPKVKTVTPLIINIIITIHRPCLNVKSCIVQCQVSQFILENNIYQFEICIQFTILIGTIILFIYLIFSTSYIEKLLYFYLYYVAVIFYIILYIKYDICKLYIFLFFLF